MRAAAYARYSTDRQTNNSIAYQIQKIQEYCTANNIQIVSEYKDEASSGTNTEDRIAFLEMIAAANRKEFQAVVVYDITRGSRDVGDWFGFRKTMRRLNIDVISVEDKLGDILNPNDFLVELLSVGIGQHAVLTTRQKSIDGVGVKAKQGAFLGGYAPLGYDIVNGEYVINEHDAAIVRKIFDMYANGQSYEHILNNIKGTCGKRGKPLGKNSLHNILKNERYIGTYSWNKRKVKVMRKWAGGVPNPNCVVIENFIPAIIDFDTWERVQKRMNDNKRKASYKAKREYLLSGLIECECCGGAFVGHTSTNKKGYEHRTYICGNKYRTHNCNCKNIRADEIEEFVVQNLKAYLLTASYEEIADRIVDAVNSASPDLTKEKNELSQITAQINNGVKAVLSGMVFPELEQELATLRMRKSELEDVIYKKQSANPTVDRYKILALFKHSVTNWEGNLKDIVNYYITKIYAHSDGSFTVNVGVHMEYCGGRI